MANTRRSAVNGVAKPTTISDVARAAGVSIATASRALNRAPRGVRAPARRRVLKAAAALDYRPNALARGLLSQRTNTLALLITDIANTYFAEVTRGVEDACQKQGYTLLICNTDRSPAATARSIDLLREKRVDGILVAAGGRPGHQPFEALPAQGIPVVVIGRFDIPVPAVRIDNRKDGREAAAHLIALGHRRIGIILGPRQSTTSQDILDGYRESFKENGISIPSEWILRGDARAPSGLRLAERLLRHPSRPTGLLTVNDQTAMAAVRAALHLSLRVPQDVSIVGYDGIELASLMSPALTTLRLPLRRMGATAAELLLRLCAGETVEREVWFVPELTVRESTGPPSPS